MSETSVEERAGTLAAAILELDRDRGDFPGYYVAVVIRPTAAEVFAEQEVRGALSKILKSDYHAKNEGSRHREFAVPECQISHRRLRRECNSHT